MIFNPNSTTNNLIFMKVKSLILVCLILFHLMPLFSQSVEYVYDASGNRLTRTIVVLKLQSNVLDSVIATKSLSSPAYATGMDGDQSLQNEELTMDAKVREQEKASKTRTISEDEEMVTIVYPNPNKGLLKIDISNMPMNSTNEMRLYDLSGNKIMVKRDFESHSEIDISQFKDGIYILRIKINERVFDWKVVKNHF